MPGTRASGISVSGKHTNTLKNTIQSETRLPWVRDSAAWPDKFYDRKGWYPALRKGEPETCSIVHPFEKRQAVAVTLASSYDDWCMALIAKEIGKGEDYEFFSRRSLNYRNLFNSETGFYHPKDSLGIWIEPFDYRFDGGLGARDYYDENNGRTWGFEHLKFRFVSGFDIRISSWSKKWIPLSNRHPKSPSVQRWWWGQGSGASRPL